MTPDDGAPGRPAERGTWAVVGRPRYRPLFIALTLFFTVFPLLSVLRHAPGPMPLALLLVGWAVFAVVLVPLFRGHPFGRPEDTWWVAIAAVLLTLIALVVQVGFGEGQATTLYFYAGVTAARLIPDRLALLGIAGVASATAVGTAVAEGDWANALTLAVIVATISVTISAMSALGRTNRELEATRRELADLAVRHERDRAADEIADVERVARESLAAVRETVSGYRQPSLAAELAGAREAFAAAGIEGRVMDPPRDLGRDVEAVLGWAVREGVTNVLRHSEARTATIRFTDTDGAIAVEVVDDGPGISAVGADGAGLGLTGLRERAASVGGDVDAATMPDGGFRLWVSVPVGVPG